MIKVLFVCLGNICRSPTAEGVFRAQCQQFGIADQIHIESAGTADWHTGKSPDPRAIAAAGKRGIDLSLLRARQVSVTDFVNFDFVLAMDSSNHSDLVALQPQDSASQVQRLLFYGSLTDPEDVPDPYYGGEDGFDDVLDLIEAASTGLIQYLIASGAVKVNPDD